jgi:hypothetical protein
VWQTRQYVHIHPDAGRVLAYSNRVSLTSPAP